MTELRPFQIVVSLSAGTPEVVRSCLLTPLAPPSGGQVDDDIWLPTAPGITPEVLPPPPTIIDTSPNEIIGCIESTGNNPQIRLGALFPSPSEGDGVIERLNNDIWVYRTDEWINVGPTPGPTVIVGGVIPFWNEKVFAIGRTRTSVSVRSIAYALQLLTDLVATTRTKVRAVIQISVKIPFTPLISIHGSQPVTINPPPIVVQAPEPPQFSLSASEPSTRGGAARPQVVTSVVTGTAPPVLGASRVNPATLATDAGWTLLFDGTADEASVRTTPFGFDFRLNGVSYQDCYVSSDSYITFGAELNNTISNGETNPPLPKILVASGNISYQRVYVKRETGAYRIRWEGNSDRFASAGNSNSFFELNFFQSYNGQSQYVEVRAGNWTPGSSLLLLIGTATTGLAFGILQQNQSFVFTGNSSGTEWTLETGRYVERSISLNFLTPSASIQVLGDIPEIETGLNIKPGAAIVDTEALSPIVSAGVSLAPGPSTCAIASVPPAEAGYRARIDIPPQVVDVVVATASISSGTSLTVGDQSLTLTPGTPSVLGGASITAPTITLYIAQQSQIVVGRIPYIDIPPQVVDVVVATASISSGTSLTVGDQSLTLTPGTPSVLGGASITAPTITLYIAQQSQIVVGRIPYIDIPPIELITATTEPKVSTGVLITHPASSIGALVLVCRISTGASAVVPASVILLSSDACVVDLPSGYWGSWPSQVYGWELDLYPDWWAD